MKKLLFILAVLSVFSCSPCKRVQRKILKHPQCLRIDSVKVVDTFNIQGFKTDTVLNIENIYDTVHLVKNNLKIKVVRVKDSIYVDGKIKDSIIYRSRWKTKVISVEKPSKTKAFFDRLEEGVKWLFVGILIMLMIKRENDK
jgi:hypothetical protein